MDGPRFAKRRHVQSLLHAGSATVEGLATILGKLDHRVASRNTLLAANSILFDKVSRTFELDLEKGGTFTWEITHPLLLLQEMIGSSTELQDLYASAAERSPCGPNNPWRMVIGLDEFTTGDKKKPKNRRKTMVVSINFLELGFSALCHEMTWMTVALCRNHVLTDVVGGWPRLFGIILRMLLLDDLSFLQAGCPLELRGRTFMLFANVAVILTDLDGLKLTFDWGGASSHRPCLLCSNVWKKDIPLLRGHVNIFCTDPSKFEPTDQDTLVGVMDMLVRTKAKWLRNEITKAELKELVQGVGFNPNPWSLLLNEPLTQVIDFTAVIRTDWVHNLLAHGTFSRECSLFACACHSIGMDFEDWRGLLRCDWVFPRRRGVKTSELHNAFSDHNEDKGLVICKASEYLSLYCVMRHHIEKNLMNDDRVALQRISFEASCKVLDLCLEAKRCEKHDIMEVSTELQRSLTAYGNAHQRAYGTELVLPKHHMCFHVPGQFVKDEGVIDMFVVERLNLRVKQVAEAVKNTEVWERSVSCSLLTKQYNQLAEGGLHFTSGLIGPRGSLPDYPAAAIARGVRLDGKEFYVNDVVLSGPYVGMVAGCALEANQYVLILRLMDVIGGRTASSARYKLSRSLAAVGVRQAYEANAWYLDGRDEYTVLH